MYLHEDCEAFRNLVVNAAQYVGTENAIVEKDYYVTLILRMLAEKHENCVFKGCQVPVAPVRQRPERSVENFTIQRIPSYQSFF